MTQHIIREIRWMERNYCKKYGKRGEVVCLDANAEVRLATFMISDFDCSNRASIYDDDTFIKEVLEQGIRHINPIICGMKVKFDCPFFCIESIYQKLMHFDLPTGR